MPEPRPQTSFPDFADVVSVRTKGELPVIVGGHAVNIWALTYVSRLGPRLSPYAPFTSKDLDLWGPKEILDSLAEKYGVKITLSPPRSPGIGYVIIPKGDLQLKVELLISVNGLRQAELENTFDLVIQRNELRVLDAISCLKAKIANAADIDQTNRQDVKHVQIMKICAHEVTRYLIGLGDQKRISERLVVNRLEDLVKRLLAQRRNWSRENGTSASMKSCPLKTSVKARWRRCKTLPSSDWNNIDSMVPRCHPKGRRIPPARYRSKWRDGVTLIMSIE